MGTVLKYPPSPIFKDIKKIDQMHEILFRSSTHLFVLKKKKTAHESLGREIFINNVCNSYIVLDHIIAAFLTFISAELILPNTESYSLPPPRRIYCIVCVYVHVINLFVNMIAQRFCIISDQILQGCRVGSKIHQN